MTLYDSTMTAIAQDDDADPRFDTDSSLFTELPATGQYYFSVEDCNSAFGTTAGCAPVGQVTDYIYQVFVADTSMLVSPEVYALGTTAAPIAQDGTTAHAATISYKVPAMPTSPGDYGFYLVDGDSYTAAANTHVFSFTPPANVPVMTGTRARFEFFLQPVGKNNGDGSASNVTAWVTDSTGTAILARADQKNYLDGDNANGPLELSAPITLGSQYYLFVKDDNAAPAAGDYYFFDHYVGVFYGNTIESEGAAGIGLNDDATNAEKLLTTVANPGYFVDGDISTNGTDVDWYEVDPPTGMTGVSAGCSSARNGSGVQGFTMKLMSQVGTGTPTEIGTATETATTDPSIPAATATTNTVSVPAGTTKMFLVLSATGQDPTVSGTSYRCGVNYSP